MCAFCLADLVAAQFKDCNLTMCDFSRSHLYRTEIIRCQAQGAVFSYVDCSHKVSSSVILSSGIFRETNFSYCDFTGANLKDCDLTGVKIMEWQQRFLLECIGMTIFSD